MHRRRSSAESADVADILIDLARRETKSFSTQFARITAAELRASTKVHKQPLKSASFRVLKAPDVPSILVELGFVTDRGDMKAMTSEAWRERWKGLRGWFFRTNHEPSQAELLRARARSAIPQLLGAIAALNERRSGRSDRSADTAPDQWVGAFREEYDTGIRV